jgi:hypothetical protein
VIYPDESFLLGPYTEEYTYLWSDGSENPYFEVEGEELELGMHQISVTVSDLNGCNVSDAIMINVIPYTGIFDDSNTHFTLFPNPPDRSLTIDLGRTYTTAVVTITSADSRILQKEENKNIRFVKIEMNTQPGIYFMTILSDNQRAVFKVVKN